MHKQGTTESCDTIKPHMDLIAYCGDADSVKRKPYTKIDMLAAVTAMTSPTSAAQMTMLERT